MPEPYSPTAKQREAFTVLASGAKHVMAFGGSRSGKTFGWIRAIVVRALAAPGSRHAVLRFRFNHVKASVVLDTFPKVMELCFPQVTYRLDKTDWFAELPNKSQIWFGGLDEKERTEKILGQEHSTLFFNECSQIPYSSVMLALTRLAQRVTVEATGEPLRLRALYDCNPPGKSHWTHKLFVRLTDPDSGQAIDRAQYAAIQINPRDNMANLPPDYLATLEALPARMRTRFLDGKFADEVAGALWTLEGIEKQRADSVPDMQRIVIAVDPSGSGDEDNAANDEIGIMVCGIGMDGIGYVLEDLTCKAGPKVWGSIATNAFDRHRADRIVGETNYGGDMVRFVVQTAKPNVPFRKVTASRGKAVRAEPISALTESGKIRFAGRFPQLEDELCSMTTNGYVGGNSPNRADAFVWAMSDLFPGMVAPAKKPVSAAQFSPSGAWFPS